MSEVIEDYIRRNPGVSLQQALENFLNEERIRSWVDGDPVRRDRLQREFQRVWVTSYSTATLATAKPTGQILSSSKQTEVPVQVDKAPKTAKKGPAADAAPPQAPAPRPAAPPPPAAPPVSVKTAAPPIIAVASDSPRKLKVLCTTCGAFAVHAAGTRVTCAKCGTDHADMLGLVPVAPVGPFAFTFGTGWRGVVRATILGAALAALYGVLKWV